MSPEFKKSVLCPLNSQFKVAIVYEVSGKIDEAKYWYVKAANQGHEESAERMKELP
jgi:TPR repeat protein